MCELEDLFRILSNNCFYWELQSSQSFFKLTIETDDVFEGYDLKEILTTAIKFCEENY